MLNRHGRGKGAAQDLGRATGSKFESAAVWWQKIGHFFQKLATQRWKNPFGDSAAGIMALLVIFGDEQPELSFECSDRL